MGQIPAQTAEVLSLMEAPRPSGVRRGVAGRGVAGRGCSLGNQPQQLHHGCFLDGLVPAVTHYESVSLLGLVLRIRQSWVSPRLPVNCILYLLLCEANCHGLLCFLF